MSNHASGTLELKSWQEAPYSETTGGPRLVRASVAKSFHGDIEANGTLEYLVVYLDDGSASFMGLEQVVGRIGDRAGSFVLRHDGTFEGTTARATWSVVPDTGTGELRGLRGEGGFVWGHGEAGVMTLDHDFSG
ncbi:MAG TPA: DUF3224 domain-containing protein [Chloroflexota bacterium]|nr:DUF3224 domain-containing protein [Chloroflexota bacterium]